MKNTFSHQKTSQRRVRQDEQRAPSGAGPNGLAVTPPQNRTGLPDGLKSGVESLSGLAMDDVRVHYNSSKPANLQALAYTQGTDIHVAPGEERHLPHEAWHVVQQKLGRVKPTTQVAGEAVNDSQLLESEADNMGNQSLKMNAHASDAHNMAASHATHQIPVQRASFKKGAPIQTKPPGEDDLPPPAPHPNQPAPGQEQVQGQMEGQVQGEVPEQVQAAIGQAIGQGLGQGLEEELAPPGQ